MRAPGTGIETSSSLASNLFLIVNKDINQPTSEQKRQEEEEKPPWIRSQKHKALRAGQLEEEQPR